MAKNIEGHFAYKKGMRFAVVISRTNALITERLLDGCKDALLRHGTPENAIDVIWVPGAYELPLIIKTVCTKKKYGAVIALGCVIRGGTTHYEYICNEASRGITQASLNSGIPVAFGVLTCDNLEQALDRAGAKHGNKGFEAALSVLEMADLLNKI